MRNRYFVSLLALLLCTSISFSQGFVVLNSRPMGYGITTASFDVRTKIRNMSGSAMNLAWARVETGGPSQWEISVCEEQCSGGYSRHFRLGNRQDRDIKVTVNPHGAYGAGLIRVVVFNPLDSANTATMIDFEASASVAAGVSGARGNSTAKIYPNPAVEFIQIEDGDDVQRLEVYDMLGNPVIKFPVNYQGEKYYINNLPRGLYLYRLIDHNGNIIVTQRFSKYNP